VSPSRHFVRFISSLRPAWLASAALDLFGVKRIVFESHRGAFWVDPGSQFGRELMDSKDYDLVVTEILDRYLRPGDTFIDTERTKAISVCWRRNLWGFQVA
jgi:hypothetical protein